MKMPKQSKHTPRERDIKKYNLFILRCDFIGGGAEIVTVNTAQHFLEQGYGRVFNQLVRNSAVRYVFVFVCRDNTDRIFASLADGNKLGNFFLDKAGFFYGKRNACIGGKLGSAVINAHNLTQLGIPVLRRHGAGVFRCADIIQLPHYRRFFYILQQRNGVGNITAKDIEDFYEWMFASGVVANTVIHYHTVLHSAFKRAFKDGLIDSNPFDRIDRPKKNKFTGENYSEEELIAMLGLIRGDIIYPAVMLAGGLGLRRSEALGARWSRVDWEKKTILLDTKIIEYKENGKVIVEPVEEMKNKSSRRTLPLPDPVYEMLCEEREKQDLYRRMFKGSYNRKYDDYICVDQLGGLIRPNLG